MQCLEAVDDTDRCVFSCDFDHIIYADSSTMADRRYKAVTVDEKNVNAPDEPVKIIEKDIPRPGNGEVLVRVFLRPVSMLLTFPTLLHAPGEKICLAPQIADYLIGYLQVNPSDVMSSTPFPEGLFPGLIIPQLTQHTRSRSIA